MNELVLSTSYEEMRSINSMPTEDWMSELMHEWQGEWMVAWLFPVPMIQPNKETMSAVYPKCKEGLRGSGSRPPRSDLGSFDTMSRLFSSCRGGTKALLVLPTPTRWNSESGYVRILNKILHPSNCLVLIPAGKRQQLPNSVGAWMGKS